MAEVVLRHEAMMRGLGEVVVVDSAGTVADVGFKMDSRAARALEARGYAPSDHRARQFEAEWFFDRELVVALDRGHLRHLWQLAPAPAQVERVRLLLSFSDPSPASRTTLDVPDPYFGGQADFEHCLDLIEGACDAILAAILAALPAAPDADGVARSPG